MTKLLTTALSLIFLTPGVAIAKRTNKVIYGTDNRQETHLYGDKLFRKKAKSVAAMIPQTSMTIKKNGAYALVGKTFKEHAQLCEGEKFSEQLAVSDCTAFLVGRSTMITAGHCAPTTTECQKYNFVFGFVQDKRVIPAKDIYTCKRVMRQKLDRGPLDNKRRDWAVIELDRPVTGRKRLKFRKKGAVAVGAELVLIGHPVGLPQKIADQAYVRSVGTKVYMMASTDSFGGNSGSPVFNQKTGLVEGILVRGEADFAVDWVNSCRRTNICPQDGCRGEGITRITQLQLKKYELRKRPRTKK